MNTGPFQTPARMGPRRQYPSGRTEHDIAKKNNTGLFGRTRRALPLDAASGPVIPVPDAHADAPAVVGAGDPVIPVPDAHADAPAVVGAGGQPNYPSTPPAGIRRRHQPVAEDRRAAKRVHRAKKAREDAGGDGVE